MARKFGIAASALVALSLVGTAAGATLRAIDAEPLVAASQEGEVFQSDLPGALDRPSLWNCGRIFPEYERWLDSGKPADGWPQVGRTYRDTETGKLYDWQDWLDWADDAGCVAGVPVTNAALGLGIAALGSGLLLIGGGSNAKSPG